jgi:hypothetical protein
VIAVAYPDPRDAGDRGLPRRKIGREAHHDLAESVVAVDKGDTASIAHDPHVCPWIESAACDPLTVRGKPLDAVGAPAPQVGIHHPRRRHGRVLVGDAVGAEHGFDEAGDRVDGDANFDRIYAFTVQRSGARLAST